MGLSIVPVSIWREANAWDLPLPSSATPGSAGLDLSAALEADLTVLPGQRAQISTGICIALPDGFEAQIRPRSGLALSYGLTLLNSPGTIDSDYRGVIYVIIVNLGQEPVVLRRGDRIAQLVVAPVVRVAWAETTDKETLTPTQRGEGGFGSSGR